MLCSQHGEVDMGRLMADGEVSMNRQTVMAEGLPTAPLLEDLSLLHSLLEGALSISKLNTK